jgi:hypothetical protein
MFDAALAGAAGLETLAKKWQMFCVFLCVFVCHIFPKMHLNAFKKQLYIIIDMYIIVCRISYRVYPRYSYAQRNRRNRMHKLVILVGNHCNGNT